MVTQALTEFCELPEYCDAHHENPDFKTDMHNALQELAVLTAKMHKHGYYFSLDARNIFIRKTVKSGQNNLALIDLDHIHHAIAGIMPKRRIKRNLARFKKTLAKLNGSLQYEYTKFLETYTENLVKNQHSGDKHNAR